MVLVFTLGGKFTQSSFGTLVELLYDAEQLLSLLGVFALLVSFFAMYCPIPMKRAIGSSHVSRNVSSGDISLMISLEN